MPKNVMKLLYINSILSHKIVSVMFIKKVSYMSWFLVNLLLNFVLNI